MVLLYSFHVAPPRENESCIDETSGEAHELHFLLALWLQRHFSFWGALHGSSLHTEGNFITSAKNGNGIMAYGGIQTEVL